MPGLNGLVVMKPTSIASTGTGNSSSIGANGKVTFSSCATLSLNGVFTSSYDNYMISIRSVAGSSGAYNFHSRLRASGSDATGSNYTHQALYASGNTFSAGRATQTWLRFGEIAGTTLYNGQTIYLFGPNLAQETAWRSVDANAEASAAIYDLAGNHSLTTQYDGITFAVDFATPVLATGIVTVYGFNQ